MGEGERPRIGAAMMISMLAEHRDWLIEGQRDVEIQDPVVADLLDGDWRSAARRGRDLLDGHRGRRGVHGPFDGLTLCSKDRRIQQVVADRLCQGIEFAAELGATHMVVHSPFLFFGGPFLPHSPAYDLGAQLDQARTVLEPALRAAADADCTLVVEGIFDKNPSPLLTLAASIDSPRLRLSVDVGHAFIGHQGGGPSPDAWVRAFGPLLEHVHLQDTDGLVDRHWAPGDGAINWFALFEAIGALSHRPRLILELKDRSAIPRGWRYLVERGLAS